MIIYNSTRSILIQWIRVIFSCDILSFWPRKYNRKHTSCLWQTVLHVQRNTTEMGGQRHIHCTTISLLSLRLMPNLSRVNWTEIFLSVRLRMHTNTFSAIKTHGTLVYSSYKTTETKNTKYITCTSALLYEPQTFRRPYSYSLRNRPQHVF